MKKIFPALALLGLLSCNNADTKEATTTTTVDTMATSGTASTGTTTEATPAAPVDSATMMKNWQAYMTPGDVHKMMASWNGSWNGTMQMWHMPNTPPETSKVNTVNRMIMGGRYQVNTHTGTMMGMPFEGTGTLAYDNAKKKFISTWIDNMGTGIMLLEGGWDEGTKSMTLTGKCVDPSAGNGKETPVRETFTSIDANTQLMEMYGPAPDGKEFKMMEIKFTRK
ncbi:MAG: hypothetical protein JWQ27_1496 [Ferruginibacter sp.]|nr:hypothetical protein [Ferruginibacter sp.]